MPSYLITGVSKGIGFEILRQISSNPKNKVVGLVRDKAATEKKVAAELPGRDISIVSGDLENWKTLYTAAEETAKITGGSLDYLIANAGWPSLFDGFKPIGALGPPEEVQAVSEKLFQINCTGNIHLYNAFIPLIQKGEVKKVVNISTGMADIEWINQYDIEVSPLYSMSKAAMNIVTAKFSAQYKKDGILFLGICPGMVDVGHYAKATPEELESVQPFMAKLIGYAPSFAGPRAPELAVKDVIDVWERASFERGDGGAYLSHFGNRKWI